MPGRSKRVDNDGISENSGRDRATRQRTREPAAGSSRRLRAKGRIPAVIYGHKQAVVPIRSGRDDVWRMIKTPGHLADLDVGGTTETF